MTDRYFVEKRPEGDFAVRKYGSERASVVEATQAEAIRHAHQIDPDASVLAERVRYTSFGKPDKWRKT